MLLEAKEDLPDSIYIRFRTDGSFFNLLRLLARTKTIEELITMLLCADNCALLAHTEEVLQHIVNRFSDAAKNFGLTISLKKTEVLYQRSPREAYSPPRISVNGTNLNAVENFTYLDSVISGDATVIKDLDNRLRANLPSIESILLQVQLCWAGHVTRMEDVRMPKAVFFSELEEGKRDRGAPRKRYKDQLKRQLAQAGISHQS